MLLNNYLVSCFSTCIDCFKLSKICGWNCKFSGKEILFGRQPSACLTFENFCRFSAGEGVCEDRGEDCWLFVLVEVEDVFEDKIGEVLTPIAIGNVFARLENYLICFLNSILVRKVMGYK